MKQTQRSMGTNSPEINSCFCGHLFFEKGGNNIQRGKESPFGKCVGESGLVHAKTQTGLLLQIKYKINSTLIKDLNVRPEAIKLLEKNRQCAL